jgi:hypothetical protein
MDVIGIIGLAVAVVALGVPFTIEAVKAPRLRITPSEWRNPAFVPWTFATVRVRNEPVITPLVRSVLMRQSAQGCKAEIEYCLWDSGAPFLRLPGRWSSVPEPLRFIPLSATEPPQMTGGTMYVGVVGPSVSGGAGSTAAPVGPEGVVGPPVSGGTAPTASPVGLEGDADSPNIFPFPPVSGGTAGEQSGYRVVYDPSRDPGQRDIAVSEEGEQIAVAILRGNKAFAFTSESYRYPGWENPAWRLERGKTYRIVVRVRGSDIQQEQAFKLEYLTNNPSEFRLQEIE